MNNEDDALTSALIIGALGVVAILTSTMDAWATIGRGASSLAAVCALASFVAAVVIRPSERLVSVGVGGFCGVVSVGAVALTGGGTLLTILALLALVSGGVLAAVTVPALSPIVVALAPVAIAVLAAGGSATAVGLVTGLVAFVALQTSTMPETYLGTMTVARGPTTSPAGRDDRPADRRPLVSERQSTFGETRLQPSPEPVVQRRLPADRKPALVLDDAGFYPLLGEGSRSDGHVGQLTKTLMPYTSASEADEFVLGSLRIVAQSSRGSSHVHAGDLRQDNYALSSTSDGAFAVAAVSDGLGSAPASHVGSYWATRLAVGLLATQLESMAPSREFFAIHMNAICNGMAKQAADIGITSESNIASTLVICVAPTSGEGPVHFARVGDSDVLLLCAGQWQSAFSAAPDSLVESGATNSLPHDPEKLEYVVEDWSDFDCALVATDGVSRVIENAPNAVGGPFAERLQAPCTALEFQALIGFRRRGAHDDRTAIAMWG